MPQLNLPIPSPGEQQLSQQLSDFLRQIIREAGGKITFADYMQQVLYAPGLGYYVNGKHKFGAQGDFVTAPELSATFSHGIATQAAQVLAMLDHPIILEFGAGSGIMAADMLQYLQQIELLPTEYWILEPSADLQQLQQQTLQQKCPQFISRVKWLNELPQEPFSGVVLANEVLDAMPVHRFHYDGRHYQEVYVDAQLQPVFAKISSPELQIALDKLPQENFSAGYESEINLWLAPWINSIADILQGGLVLLIDYGYPRAEYYHPERQQGTLRCYYRHHAHDDPFLYPGLQDITAHVDFTAVAEAAVTADLTVAGYCQQAAFLLSCGVKDTAIIQLGAMGELFKVIALTRKVDADLLGFNLVNKLGRL